MGFTSGFTGGITLTLGIAWLTVLAHERNRRNQALNLKLQSHLLDSILDPEPISPRRSRAELAREERSSLIETAKDRWNEELEDAVRRVQKTDWVELRREIEGAVARLFGRGLEKGREGVEAAEEKAKPMVQEAIERSKAAAAKGKGEVEQGIERAGATAVATVERVGAEAKDGAHRISESVKAKSEKAFAEAKEEVGQAKVKAGDMARSGTDRAVAEIMTGAHDAAESIRHSGGTVNAARGAVREAVQKGIEKGKGAVGRAKARVGLAEEKFESRSQSKVLSHSSDVEKALHERYEMAEKPEKSVEETLAERYKPIDEKHDNVPRGV